jgi:hypothetical protein
MAAPSLPCDTDSSQSSEDSDLNNDNARLMQEIFPYPGNTKSNVWKYFGFLKKKEGPASKSNLDMSFAVCRLCLKKYANKGNKKCPRPIRNIIDYLIDYTLPIISDN